VWVVLMLTPNISWMYKWLNNFFPGVHGESQDYLQVGRASDGTIVGWIDEEGHLQGSLAYGIPTVQNSLLAIDTNVPQSVSNTNIATTVYQIAVYLESRGDGAPGTTC